MSPFPLTAARDAGGIRVHRSDIGPDEATKANRIAVTTPARTLLDLAAEASMAELEQATAKVLANRAVSRQKLRDLLARHPRRPGAPRLRELLEGRPAMTRAETERRLLSLIRRARLAAPDANVMLDRYE